jgi:hypothetical protein
MLDVTNVIRIELAFQKREHRLLVEAVHRFAPFLPLGCQ